MRVWAMVLPMSLGRLLGRIFKRVGDHLAEYTPGMHTTLVLAEIPLTAGEYIVASFFSAFTLGYALLLVTFLSLTFLELAPGSELVYSAAPAAVLTVLDLFVLLSYPKIIAGKRAELIERDLIFALKDLLLNMSAGLTLFESLKKVSQDDHGLVSEDFRKAVENTNRGMPLDEALEELALRTSSEFMRNALWQVINATKAGTSVREALSGIIEALIREHKRRIRNFIQELNMLGMVYMLFAVAIPTIIMTVMVVMTSLMGSGIDENVYALVLSVCFIIQVMLVGFIKSRRPMIFVT